MSTLAELRQALEDDLVARREALTLELSRLEEELRAAAAGGGGRHMGILQSKIADAVQRVQQEADVEGRLAEFDRKAAESEERGREAAEKGRHHRHALTEEEKQEAEKRRTDKCITWSEAAGEGVRSSRKRVRFAAEEGEAGAGKCPKCGTRTVVDEVEAKRVCPLCGSASIMIDNISTTVNYGDSRFYNASAYLAGDSMGKRLSSLQMKDRSAPKEEALRKVAMWCASWGLWDARVLRRPEVLLTAMRVLGLSDDYHRLPHFAAAMSGMLPPRIDSWAETQVLMCVNALRQEAGGEAQNNYHLLSRVLDVLGFDHMKEYLQSLPSEAKLAECDDALTRAAAQLEWHVPALEPHATLLPRLAILSDCVASDDMRRYFLYLRDVEELRDPWIVHASCRGLGGAPRCRHCKSEDHATSAHGREGRKEIALPDGPPLRPDFGLHRAALRAAREAFEEARARDTGFPRAPSPRHAAMGGAVTVSPGERGVRR